MDKRQKEEGQKSFIYHPFVFDPKRKPRKMKPSEGAEPQQAGTQVGSSSLKSPKSKVKSKKSKKDLRLRTQDLRLRKRLRTAN